MKATEAKLLDFLRNLHNSSSRSISALIAGLSVNATSYGMTFFGQAAMMPLRHIS